MRHRLVISGKSSPSRDTRIFLPGTVADRVMRRLLEHEDPQRGMMASWVPEMFEYYANSSDEGKVRWRGQYDYMTTRNFVREAVELLEPILFKEVIPFDYAPELKFKVPIGIPYLDGHITPIYLVGGIDIIVCRDNGRYRIYDLKCTANDNYWKQTLGQLTFYDIALTHYLDLSLPPEKLGFIQPKCKEPIIEISIGASERNAMMARIISMAQNMWRREWEANKTSQCSMCEVKPSCPEWKPKNILRDERGRKRASL